MSSFFYKECLKEIREIIYMDDGTAYYIFKFIKKFYTEVKLLYMIWPLTVQSSDLNPIENI